MKIKTIKRGFSLTELLVVMAVGAVLFSIILVSIKGVRDKVLMAEGIQAMRNLGLATSLYASENNNRLPQLDSTSQFVARESFSKQLVTYLLPYLEASHVEVKEYVPGTASSAFLSLVTNPSATPAYWANPWVIDENGLFVRPFGYRGGTPAMNILQVFKPQDQVALIDYDNLLPSNTGNPIVLGGPVLEPLYGNNRLALYYDWSVRAVAERQNFYLKKEW